MTKSLRIAIAGLGTVGTGVVRILQEQKTLIAERGGQIIELVAVSAKDKKKKRPITLGDIKWYDDAIKMVAESDADVIVELIGGSEGTAYEVCKTALMQGKHVVTANKALLARHGIMLATLAEQKNVTLAFEAAVAGGIPIIKALKEGLSGNQISKIAGIMNGTCNYILTNMRERSQDFAPILKEAQELGYAEADPTFDVDGIDTAHKLALLTSVAFGVPVDFEAIYKEGIRHITLDDIRYAKELGYKIKLLGVTSHTQAGIEQAVYPALVPDNYPLANIEGVDNAVLVQCSAVGKLMLAGPGAGSLPTASAVVADIIDIAAGRRNFVFNRPVKTLKTLPALGMDAHVGEYYIRLHVEDKAGVLARIMDVLGKHKISLESLLQKPAKASKDVYIVGVTHATDEKRMMEAVQQLAKIDSVLETPHVIRIEALQSA